MNDKQKKAFEDWVGTSTLIMFLKAKCRDKEDGSSVECKTQHEVSIQLHKELLGFVDDYVKFRLQEQAKRIIKKTHSHLRAADPGQISLHERFLLILENKYLKQDQ